VNFVDMWGLMGCPGKFLKIRPSEIEFESIISALAISQYLRSSKYSTFLIAKKFENYTL